MKLTQPPEVRIEITGHAVHRMRERACNPEDVRSYLLGTAIALLENHQGLEIPIPYKGRLVGDFDKNGAFIGKSFLPLRFGKDRYVNSRRFGDWRIFRVFSVFVPQLDIKSPSMIKRSRGMDLAL